MNHPSERKDIAPLTVAELWLGGKSLLVIATQFDAAPETIRKRLRKARELYPDLPWGERKVRPTRSAVAGYVNMNDGVLGHPGYQAGSIVDGRARRRY
jgi:hypothetical protein